MSRLNARLKKIEAATVGGSLLAVIGYPATGSTEDMAAFRDEVRQAQADGARVIVATNWDAPPPEIAGCEFMTWDFAYRLLLDADIWTPPAERNPPPLPAGATPEDAYRLMTQGADSCAP